MEILAENGLKADNKGFEENMSRQKEQARRLRKNTESEAWKEARNLAGIRRKPSLPVMKSFQTRELFLLYSLAMTMSRMSRSYLTGLLFMLREVVRGRRHRIYHFIRSKGPGAICRKERRHHHPQLPHGRRGFQRGRQCKDGGGCRSKELHSQKPYRNSSSPESSEGSPGHPCPAGRLISQ